MMMVMIMLMIIVDIVVVALMLLMMLMIDQLFAHMISSMLSRWRTQLPKSR